MSEKVKVSKEVANAFENLKKGWTLTDIFNTVTADHTTNGENIKVLVEWNADNCDEGHSLMKLLTGDYEVEPTPEERFAELYNKVFNKWKESGSNNDRAYLNGMKATVKMLELNIEGVDLDV
ncbi:hypothetical protein ACQKMD_01350 [Viridibacillus sp. NPDC096237]|uniref:hypothetical protein n=1 Tax=Viridibacillus sp. NPDC096237 TaxID=3390721 RepID=UPI003CFD23C0